MRIAALAGFFAAVMVPPLAAGCFSNSSSPSHDADGGGLPPGEDGGVVYAPEGAAEAAAPTASLPTDPIDFGLVDCGGQPATKTYSIKNTGPVGVTWSASADSAFSIQGASSGTVAPGATASLTVAATVPTTSDPGVAVSGTLTVTTDVPGYTSVKVPLTVTPQGGSLVVAPSVVGFGSVSMGTQSGPLAFTVQNVGNAPVDLTLGAPTDAEFSVTFTGSPAPATLAPGAKLAGAGATFAPTSAGAKTATSALQTKGALCASAATSVSLSGTGTTSQVSVGPSPLDFLTTPCGKAAAKQAVTIKNGYAFAINYTTALGAGASSPYSLDAPTGSVPAKGQATINVTPAPIPVPGNIAAGAYDDTLTVTTDAPGASPTVVQLKQSAQGAILALTMATTDFGTVANTTATLPFTITNTGNLDAPVSVSATGAGFGAALTGATTAKAGGGTAPGNASFTAKINGSASGTLSIASTATLCAALPAALNLTAKSQIPVASLTGAISLNATCNGAVTSGTLTVVNTGQAPLTVTSASAKSGLFVVSTTSPLPSNIPPGQSGNVVIVAAPASGVKGGTQNFDTLVITTNEPGNPSYSTAVTVNYHGANLAFMDANGAPLSTITATTCGTFVYLVSNTGDLSATVIGNAPYSNTSLSNVKFGNFSVNGTFDPSTGGALVTPGKPVPDDLLNNSYGVTCPRAASQGYHNLATDPVCVPLPSLGISIQAPSGCSCG